MTHLKVIMLAISLSLNVNLQSRVPKGLKRAIWDN